MSSAEKLHCEIPTIDEIEELLVNNPDLDRIRAHLRKFNPIKVMGMERMEIRHSSILCWLLDPQESHGLGDAFLKAFLTEAFRGHELEQTPSALDILQCDLSDAELRTEWRNIDILILSPRNGWVFVVENKFHSRQHSDQLKRYLELATETFISHGSFSSVRGIFLTLWDEPPNDNRYAHIRYDSICVIVGQVLTARAQPLSQDVSAFILHYLQIIREAVQMDEERLKLEKLARELYREHRKVLDFIVDNGKSTDFSIAVEKVFGPIEKIPELSNIEDETFVFCGSNSTVVSILPKAWFDALGDDQSSWDGCEGWWAGLPVILWLQVTPDTTGPKGNVRIIGEVGPISDHSLRSELIDAIESCSTYNKNLRIKFQRGATDEGKQFSRFLRKNVFTVEDVHNHEQIAEIMLKALRTFRPEFEAISIALSKFSAQTSKNGAE